MEPAPAGSGFLCLLATVAGILIPVAAGIAVIVWLSSATLSHHHGAAHALLAVLVVAAGIAVALVASFLIQGAWRLAPLPGSGLADFLPHRWLSRRRARRRALDLLERLEDTPAELSRAASGLLVELAGVLAAGDPYDHGRSKRIPDLCADICRHLNLSDIEGADAQLAGLIHDIGLMTIPADVLHIRGPLSREDAALVRLHPAAGAALTGPYVPPEVTAAVRSHHERMDGRGYPDGLAGPQIPFLARLLAVVDTYDALVADRAYRRGRPSDAAFAELYESAGSQLDAGLVDALVAVESERRSPFGALWVGALADPFRRMEHALRGSALPLTAGLTALALALGAWTGAIGLTGTSLAAARSPLVPAQSPSPSPSSSPSPAVPLIVAPSPVPSPSPSPQPTPSPSPALSPHPTPSTKASPKAAAAAAGTPRAPAPTFSPAVNYSQNSGISPSPPSAFNLSPSPSLTGATPSPSPAPSPSASPPSVTSLSPATGSARGGTTVTISGSGFTGATGITFGTVQATNFTVDSDSMITVMAPPGSSGTSVEVIVTTAAGRSDNDPPVGTGDADDFTYRRSLFGL